MQEGKVPLINSFLQLPPLQYLPHSSGENVGEVSTTTVHESGWKPKLLIQSALTPCQQGRKGPPRAICYL